MATRPTFDLIDGRFYSGDLGNVRDVYAWRRDHEPVYQDDANGISAAHAREAAPDASILQLGLSYPLPMQAIRDFVASVFSQAGTRLSSR